MRARDTGEVVNIAVTPPAELLHKVPHHIDALILGLIVDQSVVEMLGV